MPTITIVHMARTLTSASIARLAAVATARILRTGPLVPFAECAVDTRRSCRTNKAKVSEPPDA